MIEALLPESVVAVEGYGHTALDAELYPEEAALVSRAVDKRRREFAAVRVCARRAMAKLGLPPQPVLPGERGAPDWQPGLVGSLTHCDGYHAAALALSADVASLGIDAEPAAPLPEGVLELVALPAERDRLSRLAAEHPGIPWDRLLFSAKEAVYKAWSPLTGKWLDFSEADVEISVDPGGRPCGGFRAGLLVPGPRVGDRRLDGFEGRWTSRRGFVATAVTVPYPA
ncbi:4'-phosphopantetheinyl transferase family protein [Streptomyces sp. SS]|uniref:4'-phosphopantetheinyl transferase family protein n=1 Tax=Streptomyces sp. SS TaxID=260742 RepID=UPI0002C05E26|nr:4'-phosphopantetheinyl transferase superfamily protein [Streptomyces sp. SS]AGG82447.1 phosphopantetheinyl transferase [Streptomyces sp. SS]